MLTREQFRHYLRHALDRLYEPDQLACSPLAVLFGVAEGPERSAALRRILNDAIESLRPSADVPASALPWRSYQVLCYRYVQQFTQREVGDELGLSVRHLRREQEASLETLADKLWSDFGLHEDMQSDMATSAVENVTEWEDTPAVNDELAWLARPSSEEKASLHEVMEKVLSLVRPLASQYGTCIDVAMDHSLPPIAAHPMALEQALISLISVALPRTAAGHLSLTAGSDAWRAEVQIVSGPPGPGPAPHGEDDSASLDMAQRLVRMCGGELLLQMPGACFEAHLKLPLVSSCPVLVIDDNSDTLQLLERYATGTRFHLITTRDPQAVLELIQTTLPHLIVLDVMMPAIDGWELLGTRLELIRVCLLGLVVQTILHRKHLSRQVQVLPYQRQGRHVASLAPETEPLANP